MTETPGVHIAETVATRTSLAVGQRSLIHPSRRYPLWPPLFAGDPDGPPGSVQYPIEVEFDLAGIGAGLFEQPAAAGLSRWQQLLPPLSPEAELGAGGTPLLSTPGLAAFAGFDGDLFIKDESRNPTWSHKDRLNAVAVSSAVLSGAPGVVVASSGNHGASAAAHAARAGLPCVVFVSDTTPAPMPDFVAAYGGTVITVPRDARWQLMNQMVERLGFHPVSNLTRTHTGHPFGPEGYKTIAYELHYQLGGKAPAALLVPTGYGELLFGIWKGYEELRVLGLIDAVPTMFAGEPSVRGPLGAAQRAGLHATEVSARPTRAHSIGTTVSSYRAILAMERTGGTAVGVTDQDLAEAQEALAKIGIWQELSGVAGLAGLRSLVRTGTVPDGPVVCIATSSGFKSLESSATPNQQTATGWSTLEEILAANGHL